MFFSTLLNLYDTLNKVLKTIRVRFNIVSKKNNEKAVLLSSVLT